MQILRHAKFSITMEIYTVVSSKKTRDALKRLARVSDEMSRQHVSSRACDPLPLPLDRSRSRAGAR